MPTTNPNGRIHYRPDERVDRNRLIPKATVRRYTEPAPGGKLDLPVPCCDRIVRLQYDFPPVDHLVLCTPDSLTYDVTVIDEQDGGYGALFEVRDEQPALARRRRKTH